MARAKINFNIIFSFEVKNIFLFEISKKKKKNQQHANKNKEKKKNPILIRYIAKIVIIS